MAYQVRVYLYFYLVYLYSINKFRLKELPKQMTAVC